MTTTKKTHAEKRAEMGKWFADVDTLLAEIEADKARWAKEKAA